ncbi:MAG: hydroxymethylpyrimidine/phosphomethylpyrimidine kinase [Gammaproteobacteria bacterium]|nr:hydroxymethylpyrimidine/phosphomethylpyrimidine kinase [Gammaproteobacteria bacterium]
MAEFDALTPVILSFSHHDPCGNSGIQADIECAASLGCHCAPIITSLFTKDTGDVRDFYPVDATMLMEQARAILEDMPIKAIKIGFTGSPENVEAIHSILQDYPSIPVILEPITHIGDRVLAGAEAVLAATENLLLPYTLITSTSLPTARDLAQQGDTVEACAQEILESGCGYVLISGAKNTRERYENHLYSKQGLIRRYNWSRINVASHGGSATLTASIACYLGHDLLVEEAAHQGQNFTRNALASSRRLGMGQQTPNRFFWADRNKNN